MLLDDRPHHIYFPDGDDPGRDLQYLADEGDGDGSQIRSLLAAIMEADEDIAHRYRSSDIPGVEGRSRPALAKLVKDEIAKWTPVLKAPAAAAAPSEGGSARMM